MTSDRTDDPDRNGSVRARSTIVSRFESPTLHVRRTILVNPTDPDLHDYKFKTLNGLNG